MTRSPAADIRIGTILRETYELTSLLGKGGMGSVFLARHLRLPGKQVAVKLLLHSEDLSDEQYARFRREAEIASQLGHPNIVEVVDFHSLEDGTPYLVMEYLRGESLAHRLRKGRLTLREAFSVARQMGSALQAAHRAGVVHRDLKPANVFLVPTENEGMAAERVKLLDFGISKLMGSQTLQTQEDVLMGTPRYMAPEQAMGRNKEVDARSDIFAFGCIVYEMLCGDSPFAGGTIAEVVYRVVHEQPESLASRVPDLPGRAVAAVDKALAKSPKDRFPDVATFIAELTGTPLQGLAGLGPDPAPMPLRGAARQSDPSLNEEDGTDATFVPSRSGVASPAAAPAAPAAQPQAAATPVDPSIEHGSTLSAFRFRDQLAPAQPIVSVTSSRRSTDVELAAVQAPAPAPIPNASPSPVPVAVAPPSVAPVPAAPVAAPVAAPPMARSSTRLVIAAAVVVVLVAGGIFVGRGMGKSPTSTPPEPVNNPPVAVTEPPATTGTKPGTEPPPVAPTPTATPTPPPPETTPPSTTPTEPKPTPTVATVEPKPPPTSPKGRPETIPASVRQDLEDAEKALNSGDTGGAIRMAQRTQQVQHTEAATLLIGRAYCHQHDLSNANAQFRGLSARGQKKLRDYCTKFGLSLSR